MGSSFAAIVGGIGGAITLSCIVIFLLWFSLSHCRDSSNRDSETGSSDPSAVVEMRRGSTTPAEPLSEASGARVFKMEELEQATRQFNESNLIGVGTFGLVFKGMLCDGTIVAVKRRKGHPRQEFSEEVMGKIPIEYHLQTLNSMKVAYLSTIQHRNLVTVLGYCQESGYQKLVSEYLPNGSMCSHLYDTGKESNTKLEFKQRLSIAIGAAKGLCHLHGLQPLLVHGNFKTANVMVDENFIAKVADSGVSKLLEKLEDASSSGSSSFNVFRDPELEEFNIFNEMNDVYSFGVFLLELISGKEATEKESFRSNDSALQWVQDQLSTNDLVDHRLVGNFTGEGMRDLIKLMLRCMSFPGRERPTMENVAMELDQILEKEITRTTVAGEGTTIVTLGSQLFTS